MVKVCDMQIHLASLCKFRPVHCANGCGVCLPEVELAEHVKYVSSWSAVHCYENVFIVPLTAAVDTAI